MLICPKGHSSAEPDYCSECGAKIQGVGAEGAADATAATGGDICPDCGTLREQKDIAFCEVCGFNFVTGAHGEVGIVPPPAQPAAPATGVDLEAAEQNNAAPKAWMVRVAVDPTLRTPESPEPPVDVVPFTIALNQAVMLIGRKDEARGIFPEIAIPFDEAISRRHALLQKDDSGALSLRDIGAANGTRLNGKEVEPMKDVPLNDGDEITLGHWTRMTLQTQS